MRLAGSITRRVALESFVVGGIGLLLPIRCAAAAQGGAHGPLRQSSEDTPGHGSRILRIGPAGASNVLVLLPGYGAAAGMLRHLGDALVTRSKDLQVWIADRREQRLAYDAQAYGNAPDRGEMEAAKTWGVAQTLSDLDRVILVAGAKKRKVFLGGHSWGATLALVYAAWDFDGRAGHRGLAGLALIDGGVLDSFAGEGITYRVTLAEVVRRLAEIEDGQSFDSTLSGLVGGANPDAAGRFYAAVARAALIAPNEISILARHLPSPFAPEAPVTNLAL